LIASDLSLIFFLIFKFDKFDIYCCVDTSPLEVLVDRASKRLYEILVIGEHVTLKVTSHGSAYDVLSLTLYRLCRLPT